MHTYCRARNISGTSDMILYCWYRLLCRRKANTGWKTRTFCWFLEDFLLLSFYLLSLCSAVVAHSVDQAAFVIWLYGLRIDMHFSNSLIFFLIYSFQSRPHWCRGLLSGFGARERNGGKINIKQWFEIVPTKCY